MVQVISSCGELWGQRVWLSSRDSKGCEDRVGARPALPLLVSWGVASTTCHPSKPEGRSGLFIQQSFHTWKFLEGHGVPIQVLPSSHPYHSSASQPQAIFIFRIGGRPSLALCSPNGIVIQMLKWLHVLIKVDVHSEGRVCVVCGVEVGDSTGSKAQAPQHCGGARVKGGGQRLAVGVASARGKGQLSLPSLEGPPELGVRRPKYLWVTKSPA